MSDGRGKKDFIILLTLLGLSLSLNVFLGIELQRLGRGPNLVASKLLPPGTPVPPIKVTDLEGNDETILFAASPKPVVLYVLSPACEWCDRNMENIKTLAKVRGESYRFIGLSASAGLLKIYVDSHAINFPVYTNLEPGIVRRLGLTTIPQTIVVSRNGRVAKHWLEHMIRPCSAMLKDTSLCGCLALWL